MEKFKILCNEMWHDRDLFCMSVNDIVKIYPFKKQVMYTGNLTDAHLLIHHAMLSDSKNSEILRKWDLGNMVERVTKVNVKIFDFRILFIKTYLADGWSRL